MGRGGGPTAAGTDCARPTDAVLGALCAGPSPRTPAVRWRGSLMEYFHDPVRLEKLLFRRDGRPGGKRLAARPLAAGPGPRAEASGRHRVPALRRPVRRGNIWMEENE